MLMERMLAKDPEDRYPDWQTLIADIDRAVKGLQPSQAGLAPGRSVLMRSEVFKRAHAPKHEKIVVGHSTLDRLHEPAAAPAAKGRPKGMLVGVVAGICAVVLLGGVALFLSGPNGSGFSAADYGNRSVYLAGGYVEANLDQLQREYSVALWFFNALPTDARDTTGVLLSTEAETLRIAGTAAGDQAGKLVLQVGEKSFAGKARVTTKQWHYATITRHKQHLRVYLDGGAEPVIDARIAP